MEPFKVYFYTRMCRMGLKNGLIQTQHELAKTMQSIDGKINPLNGFLKKEDAEQVARNYWECDVHIDWQDDDCAFVSSVLDPNHILLGVIQTLLVGECEWAGVD